MAIGDKQIREQNAADLTADFGSFYVGEPKYLPGTPEYAEYMEKLKAELSKWVRGEGEYANVSLEA